MSLSKNVLRVSLLPVIVLLTAGACFARGHGNEDAPPRHYVFADAKKQMDRIYYGDLMVTVYCGCRYGENHPPYDIDFSSCGFAPRKNAKRASRIEWEHVVTAHNMGNARQCWHKEGKLSARQNCETTDSAFAIMEGDLHNLLPSIGEVNGDRSNYLYSQWTNSPEPMYGKCETIIDFKGRKAQPRPSVRGMLARISFYMEKQYGITLSDKSRSLYEIWDRQYPVTPQECERDGRIANVQGNHNPFVESKCKSAE